MANTPPNPTISIVIFLILTISYFVIKHILQIKDFSPTYILILLATYIGSLIISELVININLTNSICGSNQWDTAFLVTAIPWVLIFGLLNILLQIFPGWLIPFSNTFGYGVVKLGGINKLLNDILKPKNENNNKLLASALEDIYSDRSLLINKISIDNFENFWYDASKDGLLNQNAISFKNQLRNSIYLKTNIAEFIWYLLAGLLTTSASYNFIINSACKHSVKEMQSRHDAYEQQINIEKSAEDTAPERRVYSTFE